MPYVAIKSYPKDEEKTKRVVERINEVLKEEWDCPQSVITVSYEAVSPDLWESEVVEKEILPNKDKMMILDGEKRF